MEWPAHQLLRQQCDVESGSDCSFCEDCTTSSGGTAVKPVKFGPCDSAMGQCHATVPCDSASSSGYSGSPLAAAHVKPRISTEQSAEQGTGMDSLQHQHAHHQHPGPCPHRQWGRRSCTSYSRLDGWYVLLAEILGTIILIAICVVAARQVRNLSNPGSAVVTQMHACGM